MANTDPFEVSKSIRPFARTIKVTEAATSARGRTGVIQRGYRPKTWAVNGKRTSITTDGDKETVRRASGGGLTPGGEIAAGLTTAGTAGAILHRDRRQKKKSAVSKGDPFEINKAEKGPFRRASFQNTRGENTKVGATWGAGMYGGIGAGVGAGVGAHEAKRGIRALHSVGAHPGKLRAAKLVAGHAGKGATALGALGAVTGAGVGSVLGATSGSKGGLLGEFQRKQAIAGANKKAVRLDRKAAKVRSRAQEFSKSAFGVEHAEIHKGMLRALKVGITSERLANAKGVASIAGKDLTSAIKHNGSYKLGMKIGNKLPPKKIKKAFDPETTRPTQLDVNAGVASMANAKSAFGVEHPPIQKAWKGTKGDKRNTKYTAAAVAGSQAGRVAGHRVAGTTPAYLSEAQRLHGSIARLNGESAIKAGLRVPGTKTVAVADAIGTAAAAGAYHAYRKKKGIAKSAFGVEHDINKADRRMGGQAEWSGHLPKHTPGAVSAALVGRAKPTLPPKAAAIRAGLKPVKIAARLK